MGSCRCAATVGPFAPVGSCRCAATVGSFAPAAAGWAATFGSFAPVAATVGVVGLAVGDGWVVGVGWGAGLSRGLGDDGGFVVGVVRAADGDGAAGVGVGVGGVMLRYHVGKDFLGGGHRGGAFEAGT